MYINKLKTLCQFSALAVLLFFLSGSSVTGQVTGLNGLKLFLDPGHSQQENMGLYNYSEAEKVLRVALELKDMFETQTDISEVHLSRGNDDDYISLEGRTTLANELGVDFYYSIHSDAGSPSANTALMLYGGWRNNGETIEKTPNGGAGFGAILNDDLSGAMRIGTRGNWADRNFYLGVVDTHENQWPYLYVNRTTNMPSLLSEAGFHTNPRQQQLNMNADWKKLEALSAFRSFLEFYGIDRPSVGIVTGIITNEDTGIPANGVSVTVGTNEYITDSYASLFNQYTTDPEMLHNGFYWIDGLTPGQEVNVVFSSDEYETKTVTHTIATNPNGRTHENLNFLDVQLTSTVPPVVHAVEPVDALGSLVPGNEIEVVFSRKMDQASVEQAITIDPNVALTFNWSDEFTLLIGTADFSFVTDYNITIDGTVAKNSATGQFLDGNSDGLEGGDYNITVTTSPEDNLPPQLVSYSPSGAMTAEEMRPAVRLVFDEEISSVSVTDGSVVMTASGETDGIAGEIHHAVVKEQSVIHFFPSVDLVHGTTYDVLVAAGLEDLYGNVTEDITFNFSLNDQVVTTSTIIDGFDSGITGWWEPQQSGSTSGIITLETNRTHEQGVVYSASGSTGSMNLSYGWDESASNNYIRLYLPPGSAQNQITFGPEDVLQVYLFGDGSNNEFRFMIKDGNGTYEASPWYPVDWKGWKLVSWDLANDPVHAWVNGNGVIDGDGGFYLDGFHFRRGAEGDQAGNFYFDDLRFVGYGLATPVKDIEKDNEVVLYPNPVRDKLNISAEWQIDEVQIYSLKGQLAVQKHFYDKNVSIDLRHLSSGYYLIRVTGKNRMFTDKIFIKN